MPELPEVTTIVTELIDAGIVGGRITGGTVLWKRSIGDESERDFLTRVTGRTILETRRRGKNVLIHLSPRDSSEISRCDGVPRGVDDGRHTGTDADPATISVHPRMSGRLYLCSAATVRTGYERVILTLAGGRELRFYDPRKFGRFLVSIDPDEHVRHLGVEPLATDFTPEVLHEILRHRQRRIKPLLMDQHLIAGLGNIYTDEALWTARIHPERRSTSIDMEETVRLRDAIVHVLQQGIANGGTSLGTGKSNFLLPEATGGIVPNNQGCLSVFQRTGSPCPRCGTVIMRIVVAQRATHFCPRCQVPPIV
ncbi:MAG: DNA-formamidopyrimidine glycosylase [Alkalispirochaeta sp.]